MNEAAVTLNPVLWNVASTIIGAIVGSMTTLFATTQHEKTKQEYIANKELYLRLTPNIQWLEELPIRQATHADLHSNRQLEAANYLANEFPKYSKYIEEYRFQLDDKEMIKFDNLWLKYRTHYIWKEGVFQSSGYSDLSFTQYSTIGGSIEERTRRRDLAIKRLKDIQAFAKNRKPFYHRPFID
ncbi:hypothetical protein [Desulfogranum marinum]|uniref:hypothetical protein n=1 Tax=Desulfogranum marinum TaxID=453220 RepID=UPI001965B1AB|nr:hypothetical protein [Desulfogranum marinum]MBM9515254.1 hypothetical protein [Desulfogranum marinum]